MPELLLEMTALALSLSLGGGSGAFGVLENAPVSATAAVSVAALPALSAPAPSAGVTPTVDVGGSITATPPGELSTAAKQGGKALLDRLSLMPAGQLEQFIKDHPDVVSGLLDAGITVKEIERWWSGSSSAVHGKLIASTPELVGNLDGVPFGTRDLANRGHLESTIAALEARLHSGVGRGMNVEVTNHLHMLTQIDLALKAKKGEPARTLVSLDTEAPGRAAIVIGDIDSADYVSYLIPGMFFTIDGQVDDWADTATALFQDQERWLQRLGKPAQSVATVAWIGYRTPHLLNVGSLQLADEGAGYLARSIEGLQSLRKSAQPYISVMAHSYGSTAALIALQRGDVEVDALAIVGSPGSSAQSASALSVRGGNVYVGEAGWDPVVNSAFYGSDPGAASYGAHRMSVTGGIDLITKQALDPSYGHNEYFRPGSESMRNLALIGIGAGGLVMNDAGVTIASAQR